LHLLLLVLTIVAGVIFLPAVLLGGIRLLTRHLARNAIAEVRRKFDAASFKLVCPNANFLGIQSSGLKQLRGNGTLVLLSDKIYFLMWVPRRECEIPLGSITRVEIAKSHLGKSFFRPLVKVHFTNSNGDSDSAAWLTDDAEKWRAQIESCIPSSS